jgi:hypothetical protein
MNHCIKRAISRCVRRYTTTHRCYTTRSYTTQETDYTNFVPENNTITNPQCQQRSRTNILTDAAANITNKKVEEGATTLVVIGEQVSDEEDEGGHFHHPSPS